MTVCFVRNRCHGSFVPIVLDSKIIILFLYIVWCMFEITFNHLVGAFVP